MMYMVYHRHTAEMCPGGNIRPDKEFLGKLNDQIERSGAKLVEGYLDAPGHEFYIVLDAENNTQLNTAIEQLRLVGDVNKIVPIMPMSKAVEWARKQGIQK
jgi:predicted deacetylase